MSVTKDIYLGNAISLAPDSGEQIVAEEVTLRLDMANRHGLVAGATGTGKTVTLQVLAEQFSKRGVPVFTVDVKGDLSGVATAGELKPKILARLETLGRVDTHTPSAVPVLFWDVFGERGHPVRATISEMGPVLLSHLLELNETQEGIIHIAFALADEEGLLLLDLKDLRSLLTWMAENAADVRARYGNVSSTSIAAIQRRLLVLKQSGGSDFFGEPALKLEHMMQKDFSRNGVVSILDARSLMQNPRIYATFLLWLLSELFEELEEIGDPEKPKLVLFFDEAHLLFNDAPKALVERIEQVVRLIRSKGVGVYFITQNPRDLPDTVLAQIGNRIQHALRAYTPREKKSLKACAEAFRPNPAFETETAITQLGVGEALISTLDESGKPSVVERVLVTPPESQIGPLNADARKLICDDSPLSGIYEEVMDRESAFELLKKRQEEHEKRTNSEDKIDIKAGKSRPKASSRRQSAGEAFLKSMLRSVGGSIGRRIARGILGSITGSRR